MSESNFLRLPQLIVAIIAGLQSLALLFLAIEVFVGLSRENVRNSSGIGVMLLLLGFGLAVAAVGVARSAHMARGPVIVAQLISLGLAWNLVRNPSELPGTQSMGIIIALAALAVLACLATPSAREALADRPVD